MKACANNGNVKSRQDWVEEIGEMIDRYWNLSGYGNTFVMMLDDILAGLGKKLRRPWDEKEHKAMFEIARHYSLAVKDLPPFTDILGSVYMNVSGRGHKSALGQYFSPPGISEMMASMVNHDFDWSQEDPVFTEPCIGAGVMVLEFCKSAAESGNLKKLKVIGIDLDITCVKMASIQLAANAIHHDLAPKALHIFHGNALKNDDADLFFGWDARNPKTQQAAGKQLVAAA